MKKVKVTKDFLSYRKNQIIDLYSLEDLKDKERKNLLEKNCLTHCKLASAIYGDEVLGFVVMPSLNYKQNYLHVLKANEVVEDITQKLIFTKSDLKSGDVVLLNNQQKLIFVNRQVGFVSIEQKQKYEYHEFRFLAFNEDLSHFQNDETYKIIKVYRFKNNVGLNANLSNSLYKAEIVFERKEKEFYTLKEASQTGKKFKHKSSKNYSCDLKTVLDEAYANSGDSLLKLIDAKEYEVEE